MGKQQEQMQMLGMQPQLVQVCPACKSFNTRFSAQLRDACKTVLHMVQQYTGVWSVHATLLFRAGVSDGQSTYQRNSDQA